MLLQETSGGRGGGRSGEDDTGDPLPAALRAPPSDRGPPKSVKWPMRVDYTAEESRRMLRSQELLAYSAVVSAFRAQGPLTEEKKHIMSDLQKAFSISTERHRAEIRRVTNDERLGTISEGVTGDSRTSALWAMEGRRSKPLLRRLIPETVFTSVANQGASTQLERNLRMPLPSQTAADEFTLPPTSVPTSMANITLATSQPKQYSSMVNPSVIVGSRMSIRIRDPDENENVGNRLRGFDSSALSGLTSSSATLSTSTSLISKVTPSMATSVGSFSARSFSTPGHSASSHPPVKITMSATKPVSGPGATQKVILVSSTGAGGGSVSQKTMTVPVVKSGTPGKTSIVFPSPTSAGYPYSHNITMQQKARPKTITPRLKTPIGSMNKPGMIIPVGPQSQQQQSGLALLRGSGLIPSTIPGAQAPSKAGIQIKQEGTMKIITSSGVNVGSANKVISFSASKLYSTHPKGPANIVTVNPKAVHLAASPAVKTMVTANSPMSQAKPVTTAPKTNIVVVQQKSSVSSNPGTGGGVQSVGGQGMVVGAGGLNPGVAPLPHGVRMKHVETKSNYNYVKRVGPVHKELIDASSMTKPSILHNLIHSGQTQGEQTEVLGGTVLRIPDQHPTATIGMGAPPQQKVGEWSEMADDNAETTNAVMNLQKPDLTQRVNFPKNQLPQKPSPPQHLQHSLHQRTIMSMGGAGPTGSGMVPRFPTDPLIMTQARQQHLAAASLVSSQRGGTQFVSRVPQPLSQQFTPGRHHMDASHSATRVGALPHSVTGALPHSIAGALPHSVAGMVHQVQSSSQLASVDTKNMVPGPSQMVVSGLRPGEVVHCGGAVPAAHQSLLGGPKFGSVGSMNVGSLPTVLPTGSSPGIAGQFNPSSDDSEEKSPSTESSEGMLDIFSSALAQCDIHLDPSYEYTTTDETGATASPILPSQHQTAPVPLQSSGSVETGGLEGTVVRIVDQPTQPPQRMGAAPPAPESYSRNQPSSSTLVSPRVRPMPPTIQIAQGTGPDVDLLLPPSRLSPPGLLPSSIIGVPTSVPVSSVPSVVEAQPPVLVSPEIGPGSLSSVQSGLSAYPRGHPGVPNFFGPSIRPVVHETERQMGELNEIPLSSAGAIGDGGFIAVESVRSSQPSPSVPTLIASMSPSPSSCDTLSPSSPPPHLNEFMDVSGGGQREKEGTIPTVVLHQTTHSRLRAPKPFLPMVSGPSNVLPLNSADPLHDTEVGSSVQPQTNDILAVPQSFKDDSAELTTGLVENEVSVSSGPDCQGSVPLVTSHNLSLPNQPSGNSNLDSSDETSDTYFSSTPSSPYGAPSAPPASVLPSHHGSSDTVSSGGRVPSLHPEDNASLTHTGRVPFSDVSGEQKGLMPSEFTKKSSPLEKPGSTQTHMDLSEERHRGIFKKFTDTSDPSHTSQSELFRNDVSPKIDEEPKRVEDSSEGSTTMLSPADEQVGVAALLKLTATKRPSSSLSDADGVDPKVAQHDAGSVLTGQLDPSVSEPMQAGSELKAGESFPERDATQDKRETGTKDAARENADAGIALVDGTKLSPEYNRLKSCDSESTEEKENMVRTSPVVDDLTHSADIKSSVSQSEVEEGFVSVSQAGEEEGSGLEMTEARECKTGSSKLNIKSDSSSELNELCELEETGKSLPYQEGLSEGSPAHCSLVCHAPVLTPSELSKTGRGEIDAKSEEQLSSIDNKLCTVPDMANPTSPCKLSTDVGEVIVQDENASSPSAECMLISSSQSSSPGVTEVSYASVKQDAKSTVEPCQKESEVDDDLTLSLVSAKKDMDIACDKDSTPDSVLPLIGEVQSCVAGLDHLLTENQTNSIGSPELAHLGAKGIQHPTDYVPSPQSSPKCSSSDNWQQAEENVTEMGTDTLGNERISGSLSALAVVVADSRPAGVCASEPVEESVVSNEIPEESSPMQNEEPQVTGSNSSNPMNALSSGSSTVACLEPADDAEIFSEKQAVGNLPLATVTDDNLGRQETDLCDTELNEREPTSGSPQDEVTIVQPVQEIEETTTVENAALLNTTSGSEDGQVATTSSQESQSDFIEGKLPGMRPQEHNVSTAILYSKPVALNHTPAGEYQTEEDPEAVEDDDNDKIILFGDNPAEVAAETEVATETDVAVSDENQVEVNCSDANSGSTGATPETGMADKEVVDTHGATERTGDTREDSGAGPITEGEEDTLAAPSVTSDALSPGVSVASSTGDCSMMEGRGTGMATLSSPDSRTDASRTPLSDCPSTSGGRKKKRKHSTEIPLWRKASLGLINRLIKYRGRNRTKHELNASAWFLRPVCDEEAPNYSHFITKPMDFGTIKRKCEANQYETLEEFHTDVLQVRINCHTYNTIPEHNVRKDCEEVFAFYLEEHSKIQQKAEQQAQTDVLGPKIPKLGD